MHFGYSRRMQALRSFGVHIVCRATMLAAFFVFFCCSLICLDGVVLLSYGRKLPWLSPFAGLVQTKRGTNFLSFSLGSDAQAI